MEDCLILDSNWQPQSFCSWKDAMRLTYKGRAKVIKEDEAGGKLHSSTYEFGMPRVIVVRNAWVRRKREAVPMNRRNILLRDDHECQYCGHELTPSTFTLDHVIPRSQGGESTWTNLVAACVRCNKDKAGQTPKQAGVKLLKAPVEPKPTDPRFNFKLHVRSLRPEWKEFSSWLYYHVVLEK
jgi:5-methylcytosine-specific restriction endonuclease McrA